MTVAAYDGIQLVVDGAMTWGNMPVEMITTKAIVCDQWVIAMAGETRHTMAVKHALKGVAFDENELPILPGLNGGDPSFEAIAVSRNQVCLYQGSGIPIELDVGMIAIGCGCDLAIGAMAHGATAQEAVRIAIDHDIKCCPPIFVYSYTPENVSWSVDRYEH